MRITFEPGETKAVTNLRIAGSSEMRFDAVSGSRYGSEMHKSFVSRRDFLKRSAATILTAGAAAELAAKLAAADSGRKIPVGLQLYSIRHDCEKDLPGSVKAVAKMGYKGVEFAGYYGRDAKTLRTMLDDLGLKCCGTHTGIDTLLGDNLSRTIEFNKILGNPYLIVPGLPGKYTKSRQAWRDTADLFNEMAEKVKPHGMRVGYHNHTIEFKELEGELPWDTFFSRTRKEVIMQFDTGNAMHGGGDATIYLKRYPGRAATVHLKPFSKAKPNALMGDDELPWPEIFELCETTGGTEWYIIEYESDAYAPMVSVQKSLEVMCRWGKC
jgi:sugar phosphate isomerase/epimerase